MAAKKKPRKTAKKSGRKSGDKSGVSLVTQPHGGAIRHGSQPGNTPGTGRPPSEVKARALGSFDERITILEGIADRTDAADADRIRAVDKLGKYGFADGVSRVEVRKALHATLDEIRAVLSPEVAEGLLASIKPHWSQL